jgi:protoheme IX farnesyltransferase
LGPGLRRGDRGWAFFRGPGRGGDESMSDLSEVPVAAALRAATAPVTAVADYVEILKPRVMSLVVFTGLVGLVLAPGHIHPLLAAVAVICIAVGAGAAGAINMWYDRDIDAMMRRTRGRPLPAGRMMPGEALGFGVALGVGAVLIMGLAVNWVAAELLALTIGFYVLVYTIWLKRRTPQNIVIGGAAGAFPPMIGWATVTGDIGWGAIALFAIIFFWTPPHFWALSLYRTGDYAAAGVPMLPVVAGASETKWQMLLYTLVLWPVSLAPWLLGVAGAPYGAGALVLSALFTGAAVLVRRDATERSARRMFAYSLLYLFLIFALLLADHMGGGWR